MICRISGRLTAIGVNAVVIEVGGISYDVLIPSVVMQRLEKECPLECSVSLITYHYHQVEPSRSTPVLIGFLNEIEKDFFETFITVSGIGPRAALKALNQPISLIARAIDESDTRFLQSLPGIGQQRAREIVAKLQNKVGKFGLMQDRVAPDAHAAASDLEDEALSVLLQLEYSKPEAVRMLKKAMERNPRIATTEELLNEVYKQRRAT